MSPNPKPTVCPYLGHDISIERGIKCPYCESVREFGVLETEPNFESISYKTSKIETDGTCGAKSNIGCVCGYCTPETQPDTKVEHQHTWLHTANNAGYICTSIFCEATRPESVPTLEPDTKVDSQIIIRGETYELASFGEKYSDGNQQATLRLKDVQ